MNKLDELVDEIDAWCLKHAGVVQSVCAGHVMAGRDLNDPNYRRLLGQSEAYHKMRSYLHGLRHALAEAVNEQN